MAAVPPFEPSVTQVADLPSPPYNLEAEQAVIGGLLLDNNAWDKIAGNLKKGDFFNKDHQVLFEAIEKLAQENQPFDAISVTDRIDNNKDGSVLPYLANLASNTPSAANIETYAQIVYRDSVRRQVISSASEIIGLARSPADEISADGLLNSAEEKIFNIGQHDNAFAAFASLAEASKEVVDEVNRRSQGEEESGLKTGFPSIDKELGGFQGGDLVIIAGRPSMGKTSLALNIAEHVAVKEKKAVAVFSLEMPTKQLVKRLYGSHGEVSQAWLRNPNESHGRQWASMMETHKVLTDLPLYIDDSSSLTPEQLTGRVRRLKRDRDDLSLVIIDYLQLMEVSRNTENRATEIAKISRALKGLAKEMDVPVIALSQLNRNPEGAQGKVRKPRLSDLRESGAIEQDADIVLLLYSEEKDTAMVDAAQEKDNNKVVTVDVVKNRNGPTFDTRMIFLGQFTKFKDNYIAQNIDASAAPYSGRPISGPGDFGIDDMD